MILKLTVHAQVRLQERGFSIDALKKVIREPDEQKQLEGGLIRVVKNLGHNVLLRVIYKRDGFRSKKEEYIIITAYFVDSQK